MRVLRSNGAPVAAAGIQVRNAGRPAIKRKPWEPEMTDLLKKSLCDCIANDLPVDKEKLSQDLGREWNTIKSHSSSL